jgi:hypothetical protein
MLLETALGHEVPVPPAIAHDSGVLQRFVLLMDLAVSPQMIRDGLKGSEQRAAAEALLRFLAAKPRRRAEDRDKVDVIATALYRIYAPAGEVVTEEDDSDQIGSFEEDLRRIYDDMPLPNPPNEHHQLVREFHFLRGEVADFRHFDELIDSGVIHKVRDIKETLDASFIHPSVLATIASYNVYFGDRFDLLFKRAANEVKSFAAKVQQNGGSIMSRVDGDVIVKHLAEMDEGKILNEEYGRAQENLRHVSKLKKAVDNRRFGKITVHDTPPVTPPPQLLPLADTVTATAAGRRDAQKSRPNVPTFGPTAGESPAYAMPRSSAAIAEQELQRLNGVQVNIRSFVRAADPASAHVVPLPGGNVKLTSVEVEAFRVDYGDEKSFRSDFAAALMQLAALDARLTAEWHEFQKTRNTAYNWKPHADALAHLIGLSRSYSESAMHVSALAQQRGLSEKVSAIAQSMEKVRHRAHAAAEALQSIGASAE